MDKKSRDIFEGDCPEMADTKVIEAVGLLLIPGAIDDQVHFREPGLTHKAEIYTEAKAAVAGGVTSYMEMPNTNPQTTVQSELEKKFDRASDCSLANYSFFFGATNDNLDEVFSHRSKQCLWHQNIHGVINRKYAGG